MNVMKYVDKMVFHSKRQGKKINKSNGNTKKLRRLRIKLVELEKWSNPKKKLFELYLKLKLGKIEVNHDHHKTFWKGITEFQVKLYENVKIAMPNIDTSGKRIQLFLSRTNEFMSTAVVSIFSNIDLIKQEKQQIQSWNSSTCYHCDHW